MTCALEIDVKIIRLNFENFLFSQPTPDDRAVYVLMMDDVKGSSRVRVSDQDGCLRGVCYHGLGIIDPKLVSFQQAKQVAQKMYDGEIHHGTEITNLALARNSEKGYSPVVVATSAGCSKNDPAERTSLLLHYTLKIWYEDPRGYKMRGPVTTLQPDGASQFVKAAQGMFFAKKMDASHPLHAELFQLKLFTPSPIFLLFLLGAACLIKPTLLVTPSSGRSPPSTSRAAQRRCSPQPLPKPRLRLLDS